MYRLHTGSSKKLPVTSVRFVDKKAQDNDNILIASCKTKHCPILSTKVYIEICIIQMQREWFVSGTLAQDSV